MAAANLCCTHVQQRTDSPEPPPRPLASIDSIFAAAALPEDHPHAPKLLDRKPEFDASIMKSPNFTNKIKQQFRRKSMNRLGKEKDYDDDAHRLSSGEVLQDIEEASTTHDLAERPTEHQRLGSITVSEGLRAPTSGAASPEIRASILRSLEYLMPLIQK